MCGIVGYIGNRDAFPVLIKGLKRLEYRGYDSAGVAIYSKEINIYKEAGKVADLERVAEGQDQGGTLGIGHTRWATHGEPNYKNSHPHYSENKRIVLIHNGIIENYASIKAEMIKRGYVFNSDTDTEALVHLIDEIQKNEKCELDEAVRLALNEVTGAYAIAVFSKDNPDRLIGARKGSPLVVGIGDKEFFLASDASPIIEYTKNVIYLDDEEMAIMDREGNITVKTIHNVVKTPYIQELELKLEAIEKAAMSISC